MSRSIMLAVAFSATILVANASLGWTTSVIERIEDLKEQLVEWDEIYSTDMQQVFLDQLEIAEEMSTKSAGNDSYALMEMSRLLATIQSAFYVIERNSILIERKVLEHNLDYFNENRSLGPLVSLRIGLRYILESHFAVQRPMASLYKLVEYYVSKYKMNKQSVPEEVKTLIEAIFDFFDENQNFMLTTFNQYRTRLHKVASDRGVTDEEFEKSTEISHLDQMVDALIDCKDCSKTGKVYNNLHNIRSMFSSPEELQSFVSKGLDEKFSKKMKEVEQSVEGHLSIKFDTSAIADMTDFSHLWVDCIRDDDT